VFSNRFWLEQFGEEQAFLWEIGVLAVISVQIAMYLLRVITVSNTDLPGILVVACP